MQVADQLGHVGHDRLCLLLHEVDDLRLGLCIVFGDQLHLGGVRDSPVRLSHVVLQHMVAQVLNHGWDQGLGHDWVAAEHWRQDERDVDHQVPDVVLLGQHEDARSHHRGNVLAGRVEVFWLIALHQYVGRHLQLLEEHLLNLALVVHLGLGVSALQDRLGLGESLGLAEDVGVADRDHIHRTTEVLRGQVELACSINVVLRQVVTIQAVQDLEHHRHGAVHATMD